MLILPVLDIKSVYSHLEEWIQSLAGSFLSSNAVSAGALEEADGGQAAAGMPHSCALPFN